MGLRNFRWHLNGRPKAPVFFRLALLPDPSYPHQYSRTSREGVSVDHASVVEAPKSDPVFLHVKADMTVIVSDTEGAWRMANVIWVDGGARNPKVPTLFQVADVDTGVINWINADLLTHIVPGG